MSRLAKFFAICLVTGIFLFSYALDVFAAREMKPGTAATWVKVRIYEEGSGDAGLTVGLPVGLIEWALASSPSARLPDVDGRETDLTTFWQRLRESNPKEPLEFENDGGRVQVWLE